jgi:release factor glutamine methyltransferase
VFVQTNSVQAVKAYFKERLQNQFSESELKAMMKVAICERLKLSSADYLLSDSNLLSESDLLYFRSIVKRLQHNEPFQYIVGQTEFFGLEIKCDVRALIPRPETEELVEWVLEDVKPDIALIDFCTGSGCIALAVKNQLPKATVYGTDVSKEALELSEENARNLKLEVNFIQHDALSDQLPSQLTEQSIDIIVSNPPYIPERDKQEMQANVLDYEPHMALFVENENALIFYSAIATHAAKLLKQNGLLFFEIHERLALETKETIEALGFKDVIIRKDLQGKDRMIKARFTSSS